jgi:hypothetical protein
MITLLAFNMIHFIERGSSVLTEMNDVINVEIIYSGCLVVIIVVLFSYRFSYIFTIVIIFGSCGWWLISLAASSSVVITQPIHLRPETSGQTRTINPLLVFEFLFLYLIVINSLMKPLSDKAMITKKGNQVPSGNILTFICGLATVLSGYLGGPPIILSCESVVGGGKTGLSTLICGICYGIIVIFLPFLSTVPNSVVSAVLIMIGFVTFGNIKNLSLLKNTGDTNTGSHTNTFEDKKAQLHFILSSFIVFFLVAFTNCLFLSVVVGAFVHFFISLYSGAIAEGLFTLFRSPSVVNDNKSKKKSGNSGMKNTSKSVSLVKTYQPSSTALRNSTFTRNQDKSYQLINDDDDEIQL